MTRTWPEKPSVPPSTSGITVLLRLKAGARPRVRVTVRP
jgi:hypothetical protein